MSIHTLDSIAPNKNKAREAFSDELESLLCSENEIESEELDIPRIDGGESPESKRKALVTALRFIAKVDARNALDEAKINHLALFFTDLYSKENRGYGFRHMYSDVCRLMYDFLKSDDPLGMDDGVPYENRQLENSIVIIENHFKDMKSCPNEVLDGITKLHDHIALENRRMEYMAFQNKAQKESARQLKEEFSESVENKMEEASKKFAANAADERKKLQREHIAVLGIFASIVIAFTSGMAFTSSVLQHMSSVSIYRLSFTALMIGLFVFFLVSSLLVFLNKISDTENDELGRTRKTGIAVFCILLALVIAARAFDVLSFFPIQLPF